MEYRLSHIENEQINARDIDPKFWQSLQTCMLHALKEQRMISETQYLTAAEQLKKTNRGGK